MKSRRTVILNENSKAELIERTADAELISAPSLTWEVGNALTALFRRRKLSLELGQKALESFHQIPLRLADVSVESAVEIAWDHQIYAYDAYVLECARRYQTPLLSLDSPQRRVARNLGIEVMEV